MIARSDRRRLCRHLFDGMGLGVLTGLAVASAACGGIVVDPGSGGASTAGPVGGAGGAQTGSAGSAGSGTPGCSFVPSPPSELRETCFDVSSGACPETDAAEATVAELLGVCDIATNACCGQDTLVNLPCGPVEGTSLNSCCYYGLVTPMAQYGCSSASQ